MMYGRRFALLNGFLTKPKGGGPMEILEIVIGVIALVLMALEIGVHIGQKK